MKKTQRGYNTTLRGASAKRKKQLLLENKLKELLFKKQSGLCAKCQHILRPDWWDKHEIVSRARGGDATDEKNCILLCRDCHIKITEHRETADLYPEWIQGWEQDEIETCERNKEAKQ